MLTGLLLFWLYTGPFFERGWVPDRVPPAVVGP